MSGCQHPVRGISPLRRGSAYILIGECKKKPAALTLPISVTSTGKDLIPEESPMVETLNEVKATLRRHFEIKDWESVVMIPATAIAHYASGEMLWNSLPLARGESETVLTEQLRTIGA